MVRAQEVVEASGAVVRRRPEAGDYQWDGERWRRWSGRHWATAAYSLRPALLKVPARPDQSPPVEESRRRRALALAVEDQVVTAAATVVLDGPRGVVLAYRRPMSSVFHAVMTLLTAGVWGIVWLASALGRREDRIRLEVDPWGHVWATIVAPV